MSKRQAVVCFIMIVAGILLAIVLVLFGILKFHPGIGAIGAMIALAISLIAAILTY